MTRLSYSQGQTLDRCGEAWRLERRHRKVGRPSWAAIGGSAFHNLTEAEDLTEHGVPTPIPTVGQALDDAVERDLSRSDRYTVDDIKVGGRASKAWPDKENRTWWEHQIPLMRNAWHAWNRATPWRLWVTPEGKPAVELEVDVELDSQDEPLKGFIDRVYEDPTTGRLIVVDIKTGRAPKGTGQLGVYRLGLYQRFGMLADYGTFWLGRTGMSTSVESLDEWHDDRLSWEYGIFRERIEKNLLAASPGDACSWCGVRDWCYAAGGKHANEVPRPWQDRPARVGSLARL